MRRDSSSAFLLGVNYPWLRYGEDFGLAAGTTRVLASPPIELSLPVISRPCVTVEFLLSVGFSLRTAAPVFYLKREFPQSPTLSY